MMAGRYSLIRYIADPARGEAFNIGIIVWTEADFQLSIDEWASRRAVRENPLLAKDALQGLESSIAARIRRSGGFSGEKLLASIQNHMWFPIVIADPEYVAVSNGADPASSIRATVDRLMDRMVRRRTVPAAEQHVNEAQLLETKLWPLISRGVVKKNYEIEGSKSKYTRQVDFFANGDSAVGLDVLQLKPTQRTLREFIDAEAFKIEDLRYRVAHYIVLSEALKSAREKDIAYARHIIESVAGKLVLDTADAAQMMEGSIVR
jgi:hypothetical protein